MNSEGYIHNLLGFFNTLPEEYFIIAPQSFMLCICRSKIVISYRLTLLSSLLPSVCRLQQMDGSNSQTDTDSRQKALSGKSLLEMNSCVAYRYTMCLS